MRFVTDYPPPVDEPPRRPSKRRTLSAWPDRDDLLRSALTSSVVMSRRPGSIRWGW